MNIVPAPIREHVNRVDRTRSLVIGIAAGVTALWSHAVPHAALLAEAIESSYSELRSAAMQ
jgi:hypothetical protein